MQEVELTIDEHEVIVSHTDVKGKILYANSVFCKYAGYEMEELIGQDHNIIRHPDVPKAVFKLLWSRVLNGESIYAYVKNRKKNGDYYWVKGFTVPIMKNGQVSHILSYRKKITEYQRDTISAIYKVLTDYERSHTVDESLAFLVSYLEERNLNYDDMVDRLSLGKQITNIDSLNIDYQAYYYDHLIFKSRIVQAVEKEKTDIEVASSSCCRFGKWLATMEGKSCTKHPEWKNVIKYHDEVHNALQQYVDVGKSASGKGDLKRRLNTIGDEVSEDTTKIFNALTQVINEYA